jgi:hypothetical protein
MTINEGLSEGLNEGLSEGLNLSPSNSSEDITLIFKAVNLLRTAIHRNTLNYPAN